MLGKNSNWSNFYGSFGAHLTNVRNFGTYYGRSCFAPSYNGKSIKLGYSFTFEYGKSGITMSPLQRDDNINCDF